ncbi:MAG: hypothetical protein M1825_004129 [Sarcosagium campestre]|nr:MAG: hypothetical protein M1825_004129 [Sarcosagium campestre]
MSPHSAYQHRRLQVLERGIHPSSDEPLECLDDEGIPNRFARWRNSLTALSQECNLYFVAELDRIAVYPPEYPDQTLPRYPSLVIKLPPAQPQRPGYIDVDHPHAVNHLVVSDLGDDEVLACVCDDGDVLAYRVRHILETLQRLKQTPFEEHVATKLGVDVQSIRMNDNGVLHSRNNAANDARLGVEVEIKPFFHNDVTKSAWGLAMHKNARMIAASSNTHRITVFAFGLAGAPFQSTRDNAGTDVSETDPGDTTSERDGHFAFPGCPLTAAFERDKDRRISLRSHSVNVPNISFCNTAKDPYGSWLISLDINGVMILHDVWAGCKLMEVKLGGEYLHDKGIFEPCRGWAVACLDLQNSHPTFGDEETFGCIPRGCNGRWDNSSSLDTARFNWGTTKRPSTGSSPRDGDGRSAANNNAADDDEVSQSPSATDDAELANHSPIGGDLDDHAANPLPVQSDSDTTDWEAQGEFDSDPDTDSDMNDEVDGDDDDEEEDEGDEGDEVDEQEEEEEEEEILREVEVNTAADVAARRRMFDALAAAGLNIDIHQGESSGTVVGADGATVQLASDNGLGARILANELGARVINMRGAAAPATGRSRARQALVNSAFVPRLKLYNTAMIESRRRNGDAESNPILQEENLRFPFAILQTSERLIRYFPSLVFNKSTRCICPFGQNLKDPSRMLAAYTRLNMVVSIPELSVVVVASQVGRAAVLVMTHCRETNTSAFRVEAVVPFEGQEDRLQRPRPPLLGIAAGPIQGRFRRKAADKASAKTTETWRRSEQLRRYRLMLTYMNGQVFSYELGQGGWGGDLDGLGS